MNAFGRFFRVSIFGESHGGGLGAVVDGVPPGLPLSKEDFAADLARRRAGALGTTKRVEPDDVEILSGIYEGRATGAPMAFLVRNSDTRSQDYEQFRDRPRPGHADFVANAKYGGFNDNRGGGHFSGRVTLGLVIAGAIAKKIIAPARIEARLVEAGGSADIEKAVAEAVAAEDSIGGIIELRGTGFQVGWGEPFFDSVESVVSHAAFAVPAVKGIEFGSGFAAARMRGSQHNDPIMDASGRTSSNHAGGINGGIANGNDFIARVAVKPTSSIFKEQTSYSAEAGRPVPFKIEGRHDACVALRIPVVLEAAVAVAMADLALIARAHKGGRP
jgi:chorismate synthase